MTGSWQKEKSGESVKKKVLLLITNSFAATNMIHSGLLKQLSDRYQIDILSTMIGEKEMAEINRRYDMEVGLLNVHLPPENKTLRFLRRVEKLIFSVHFNIETYQIKVLEMQAVFRFAAWLVRLSPAVTVFALRFLRKLIINISTHHLNAADFSAYHFDGVISTSPLDIRENSTVNVLAKRKIRSLAMIISWDNLTSKGIMNAKHNYVLTWNTVMASEFERLYTIFKGDEKLCVTGIARFDTYFQNSSAESSAAFRKRLSIPPANKIIFFATSAWKHFHYQSDIAADLISYIQLHPGIDLIVRCHPADRPKDYQAFENLNNVHIQYCDATDSELDNKFYRWLPDPDFLNSLKTTLQNCDVCIQVASTIRLDAAACNKPVISIAYDGRQQLPYPISVRRLYDYSHQIPLNKLGIDKMAHSRRELFRHLDQTLNDPQPNDYVRQVLPFIHFNEAKSVDTILDCVQEWLR
ncbi:CDP-glycerol glycerophosphotransferase family protein [Dyadobacter luticola]|uniref:UDP-N-acetylglucosamine 2-epimerase domain-containing protein n=1 Tax=Dyadobacter luticola TaxID=1979387 RepID=A0A5R9KPV1_9BACT|nr:CDP-glycerol glycerophosphotransferase family protein [Dyadobacter luticola]TLU98197.1 hypothetical protein FEN17_25830 [Dyadobacter luticola]